MDILHITNGDSTVESMRQFGLPGTILPWRDVLHDGPVPAGDDLAAVSEVRAGFIAAQGWGELSQVRDDFAQRDRRLAQCGDFGRVVLWFEHDLYDQLQLVQLLNWFSSRPQLLDRLFLIDHDDYLGAMPVEKLAALAGSERAVTQQQLRLAVDSWACFTSDTPTALLQAYRNSDNALPHLPASLRRLLEFYPSKSDGLNRSERQVLSLLAAGPLAPDSLFSQWQQEEEPARFMGDSSFWRILAELAGGEHPLLARADGQTFFLPTGYPWGAQFRSQRLCLTAHGQAVLAGEQDALALRAIDRHIGGVHLHPGNLWRWDEGQERLQQG